MKKIGLIILFILLLGAVIFYRYPLFEKEALSQQLTNQNIASKTESEKTLDFTDERIVEESKTEESLILEKEESKAEYIQITTESDSLATSKKEETASLSTATGTLEKQYVICIDPGHQIKGNYDVEPVRPGGKEQKPKVSSGTQGVATGKPEYVLSLEAAFLLQEELLNRDIQVVMTRDVHEVDISNIQRAQLANEVQADLFIRIHADGSESANSQGFHILTPSEDSAYSSDVYSNSLQASQIVLEKVASQYVIRQPGITYRSDISGFNWSQVPVILIEMGFMSNPQEDMNLSDAVYLQEMMALVAEGIESYLLDQPLNN